MDLLRQAPFRRFFVLLYVVTFTCVATAAWAMSGDLDPRFGVAGIAAHASLRVNAMIVQPGGKLLVAGASNGRAVVARLDASGALDERFGGGGIATIPLELPSSEATAIVLQADGRIVIAGAAYTEFNRQA